MVSRRSESMCLELWSGPKKVAQLLPFGVFIIYWSKNRLKLKIKVSIMSQTRPTPASVGNRAKSDQMRNLLFSPPRCTRPESPELTFLLFRNTANVFETNEFYLTFIVGLKTLLKSAWFHHYFMEVKNKYLDLKTVLSTIITFESDISFTFQHFARLWP